MSGRFAEEWPRSRTTAVKPVTRLAPLYMALIDPFRRFIRVSSDRSANSGRVVTRRRAAASPVQSRLMGTLKQHPDAELQRGRDCWRQGIALRPLFSWLS
jgi:hypothetical protein